MIADARFCKGCQRYTKNFQKSGNVFCLTCRLDMKTKGMLHCSSCGKAVWELYTAQNLCSFCSFAVKLMKPTVQVENAAVEQKKKEIVHAVHSVSIAEANAIKEKMQKGAVKKLASNSSALWTDQWAVQGSGKIPYIVSHKKDGEWQCSCPAWTTTTPRDDCKHILKVKLVEKVPLSHSTTVFTKQTIVVDTNIGTALKSFEKKGRKFR